MNNKLQAKDLINIGLFTVLYFVLGCCVAIPIGFVPIFLPILGALWTLITGIPFMLFAVRVKKFGMVTIMAILSGILMGLTGMGFWGVPMGVVFGLLGDLIMKSGNYASVKKTILGYGVFSLWMIGTYIPMYFMVEQSRADFASGFGEEYAAISDAMRMRGIRFGGKHPGRMVEYRLIPLMISVVKIGDELSAAALTRGLGAPVKRTDICKIGFHWQDAVMILICIAGFALTLGSRWLG